MEGGNFEEVRQQKGKEEDQIKTCPPFDFSEFLRGGSSISGDTGSTALRLLAGEIGRTGGWQSAFFVFD